MGWKLRDTLIELADQVDGPYALDAMKGTLNVRKYRGSLHEYIMGGGGLSELRLATIKRLEKLPDFEYSAARHVESVQPNIYPIGIGTYNFKANTGNLTIAIDKYGEGYQPVLVDTAETYGTEPIVANAIWHQQSKVFLATKVARHHMSTKSVVNACHRSMKALNVRFIDLYQIHWPSPTVPIEDTLNGMDILFTRGEISNIGVCNFSFEQFCYAQIKARENAGAPIRFVQNRFNLKDRFLEWFLDFYRQMGITVIGYSPFAQSYRLKAFPLEKIQPIASQLGVTPAQLMLRWVLDNGVIPIPRSNKWEHMRENRGALGWTLDPVVREQLECTISPS